MFFQILVPADAKRLLFIERDRKRDRAKTLKFFSTIDSFLKRKFLRHVMQKVAEDYCSSNQKLHFYSTETFIWKFLYGFLLKRKNTSLNLKIKSPKQV